MNVGSGSPDPGEEGSANRQESRSTGGPLGRGGPSEQSKPDYLSSPKFGEYKIAGAEARYRDQMLFTSFYLSLVALAVLLRVVLGLYNDDQFAAALIVALVATFGFTSLLWWSFATKRARNRAWGRRGEIEDRHLPGVKLNDYVAENAKYNFKNNQLENSNRIIGRSSSDFVVAFAGITTLGWVGMVGSTATILVLGGRPPATVGDMILGGVITTVAVVIIFALLRAAILADP